MTAQIVAMSSHVARTAHVCTECEAGIQPGDRYVRTVLKDAEGVVALSTHAEVCVDPSSGLGGW
jgi:hypothetical protein